MAVREALLALLADGPKHGYQLKHDFEAATGSAWPLNVGQVYTTLQRLERDGLVQAGPSQPSGPEAGSGAGDERVPYTMTDAGRAELDRWLTTPSAVPLTNRDETTMRVLLALGTGAIPVEGVLSDQRQAANETLQTLTAMKSEPDQTLAWKLQVDRMVLLTEAELRWLDRAEDRLAAGPTAADVAPPRPEDELDGPGLDETTPIEGSTR